MKMATSVEQRLPSGQSPDLGRKAAVTHNSNSTIPSQHVSHILTAVFDINSGPTVKHQYPTSIQGDQKYVIYKPNLIYYLVSE